MWQVLSVSFFYLLFFLIDVLLFFIWRNSVHIQEAQRALNVVAIKNAESAQKAADAVHLLAEHLSKL